MQWGDVPSWLVLAATAAGAIWAWRNSRGAQADAKRALDEAAAARAANERQAKAQESMAGTQEHLAEIADRRLRHALATGSVSPAEPEVAFELEWLGGHAYALRNTGTGTATGVTVEDAGGIMIDPPAGVTLGPLRSHRFHAAATLARPLPSEIEVRCNEIPSPIVVRWPPGT